MNLEINQQPVAEVAMKAVLDATLENPGTEPENIKMFVSGAVFGSNWQQSELLKTHVPLSAVETELRKVLTESDGVIERILNNLKGN